MASRADTSLDDIMNRMRASLKKSSTKNKRTAAPLTNVGNPTPLGTVADPAKQQGNLPKKSTPKKKLIEPVSVSNTNKTDTLRKETSSKKSSNPFSWKKGASVFDNIKPDAENINPGGIESNITCSRGGIESNITCSRGSRGGFQGRGSESTFPGDNSFIHTRGSKINYNRSAKDEKSKKRMFWQSRGPALLKFVNIDESISKSDILDLFSKYGELKQGTLQFDSVGDSAGSASVVFQNYSDAIKAMKALKGITMDGKQLNIQLLKSKVPKQ